MKSTRWVLPLTLSCLVFFSFGLPGPADASDARVQAFGIQGEYVEDYSLFRTFPTVAARYQNLVTASLGDRNVRDRSIGVIGSGQNSDYGVFAIYLNDLGSDTNQDAQIDLTWAKQFSGVALGAGLNWTSSKRETGDFERSPQGGHDTFNLNANQLAFTGGIKTDIGDTDQLEAAAEIAFLTWTDDQTNATNDNSPSMRFVARMMNEISDKTTLVPVALFSHIDLTGEGDADDTVVDILNLGVAAHHKVNGNDLLILGAAANYRSIKNYSGGSESNEFTRWDLPALFMALEFGVYDWLTARVGATKTLDLSTNNPPGESQPDTDTTNSRYFFGLGMGIHFDHFDIDATVNPDAVFTGGYVFSGESSQPLGRVTGTYYF